MGSRGVVRGVRRPPTAYCAPSSLVVDDAHAAVEPDLLAVDQRLRNFFISGESSADTEIPVWEASFGAALVVDVDGVLDWNGAEIADEELDSVIAA